MRKSLYIIFLTVFLGINLATAQYEPRKVKTVKAGFLGLEGMQAFDQYALTMAGFGGEARSVLADLSVKPFLMPPRQIEGSGQPISYALASCLEFYQNYNNNFKINLSPDYVSLSLRILGHSATVEEALKFLVEYGTVTAGVVNYGANNIGNNAHAAKKFTIYNYLRLFRPDTRGRQKVFEVRKSVLRGNPVLVELQVDANFNILNGIEFWEGNKTTNLKNQPLIVVSYDEDLQAFEVQNSLGSNWGKGGYMWIKYTDFERFAQNGYILIPDK